MSAARVLVVCPGRGSYTRECLGTLPASSGVLDRVDALRAEAGQPTVRDLDRAKAYQSALHVAGEHASILTAAASLADLEALSADKARVVGVVGNSMGWYTALVAAGALSLDDGVRLVDTMGSYQRGNVVGGQAVVALTDDQWKVDSARAARTRELLAAIPNLWVSIQLGHDLVLGGTEEALDAVAQAMGAYTRGAVTYPLRLPLHSAFHTPLLQATSERATAELSELAWTRPSVPLVDGEGRLWTPWSTDPSALRDWTLGPQVTATFDFRRALRTALAELCPDRIVLLGPGSNLGGAIGQTLVSEGWYGLRSKADFTQRQEADPVLVAMGRQEQRALVSA